MNERKKVFIRTLRIGTIVSLCLILGVFFAGKAYENTVKIGFGEYKKAIAISDGYIRIFDFNIKISR